MNSPSQYPATSQPAAPRHYTEEAVQVVLGHGIPSQDPDPAAQVALSPQEAEREGKSAYVGGGAVAGLAAGAAVGAAVAGPVGVVVGGTAGAIAGALGGEAAGQTSAPESDARIERLPTEAELRNADDGKLERS